MYGGLWAGATWFISSMAASTSAFTRCTPLIAPPCTALKPMADTSAASFRQPASGRSIVRASGAPLRHGRAPGPSARAAAPPISTVQRLSDEPIRSMPPRASWRSSVMSNSRYLKLVEPDWPPGSSSHPHNKNNILAPISSPSPLAGEGPLASSSRVRRRHHASPSTVIPAGLRLDGTGILPVQPLPGRPIALARCPCHPSNRMRHPYDK